MARGIDFDPVDSGTPTQKCRLIIAKDEGDPGSPAEKCLLIAKDVGEGEVIIE